MKFSIIQANAFYNEKIALNKNLDIVEQSARHKSPQPRESL